MNSNYLLRYCLCGTSFTFLITGTVLLCSWSHFYDLILDSTLQLTPDGVAYGIWKKTPIPLKLDFYFYNWTNPQDINNNTIKPRFQQIGPYSFIETKEKTNIRWNDENGTITYNQLRKWYFNPDGSTGTLDDAVVTLNPLSVSATYASRDWNSFVRSGLSVTLKAMSSRVHITRSVGQLLFDGYEDPLLKVAMGLPFISPTLPKMDKFGWFYQRNGSETFEGTYNMGTGTKNKHDFGVLYSWRYQNRIPYFPGECGKLESSAGEFFPRNLNKDSIIRFFSSDLCRRVDLEYDSEKTINNILGYKYTAGLRFLDNGTKFADNKCYCDGDCMPSGALNVSACRYGSPAFVSLPNFYNADPYYTNSVDGVNPDKEKHEFYMIFEPNSGIPLEVAARLQLNLLLQPDPTITIFNKVPKVYFPMLWFEQVARIPYDMSLSLRLLINMKIISIAIGIMLIGLGILLKFCFCYKLCTMKICTRKKSNGIALARERVPLKPEYSS